MTEPSSEFPSTPPEDNPHTFAINTFDTLRAALPEDEAARSFMEKMMTEMALRMDYMKPVGNNPDERGIPRREVFLPINPQIQERIECNIYDEGEHLEPGVGTRFFYVDKRQTPGRFVEVGISKMGDEETAELYFHLRDLDDTAITREVLERVFRGYEYEFEPAVQEYEGTYTPTGGLQVRKYDLDPHTRRKTSHDVDVATGDLLTGEIVPFPTVPDPEYLSRQEP